MGQLSEHHGDPIDLRVADVVMPRISEHDLVDQMDLLNPEVKGTILYRNLSHQ